MIQTQTTPKLHQLPSSRSPPSQNHKLRRRWAVGRRRVASAGGRAEYYYWCMLGEVGGETGKRIKNYIYNYSDLIGRGNFARVYRGVNQKTSTPAGTQTPPWPSRSSRWTR